MNIALLPGHHPGSEGASVCAGKYQAWGENKLASHYLPQVAAELRKLGYNVVITERKAAGGATPSYSAKAANATGADIALEWHFNSCAGATGAEVLYWGYNKTTGPMFAANLGGAIAEILGVRHRGALPCYEDAKKHPSERCTANGWAAFNNSRMPFFMVEPCFAGSNPSDARALCAAIQDGTWAPRVAKAIDQAIRATYT